MYEEYMQNFFNYPVGGYRNTYEQYNPENIGMNYEKVYDMVDSYPYGYNPNYIQGNMQSYQNRNVTQELEDCYPEIYKIVYPMVRKVCAKNNNYRGYSKLDIDRMVEEVYSNIEVNDAVELNIIIRILILRELLGRPRMLWTKLQTWYGSKASYATKTTFS